jgi:hypothetical protein
MAERAADIARGRQSTSQTREPNKKSRLSTAKHYVYKLRIQLNDPELGERFVYKALDQLGEAEVNNIAEYVTRKATNPAKAFVKLCSNTMRGI